MTTKTEAIRALNNELRQNLSAGTALITGGVAALGAEAVARIVKTIAVYDVSARMRDAASADRGREKVVGFRNGPQTFARGSMRSAGPMGCSGLLGPSYPNYIHAASGQISAKSNRGRVIGGVLALSRQRSLKPSPALSIGMASNHAGHRLSSLANTR
jgi:hypothetical protein